MAQNLVSFFLHCVNFVDVSIYITYFFKIFQYYFTMKENKAPEIHIPLVCIGRQARTT